MILLLKRLFCIVISAIQLFAVYHGKEQKPLVRNLDVNIAVNTCKQYQTLTGFGSSACWWAQVIGQSDNAEEAARLLYGPDGLGLNIYRYNIGGGEKDNPDSRISGNRATESFYYYNEETGEYEYDFSRDAAAMRMLDLAMEQGCVDTLVLFANSPHYSMTVTGQATGGLTENFSNLPPENYEKYADYFLTITQHFIDEGYPVKYISPINEPQWSWGGGWVGQEGCHYEPDEVLALMKCFAKEITARGIDVRLMAPESGEIGDPTIAYFDALVSDEDIAPVLGSLAYHSYWADGNTAGKLAFGEALAGKDYPVDVDMTEWCELPLGHANDDFGGAVVMARVILQDLVLTGANSWTSWVGVNNIGYRDDGTHWSDGLLAMSDDGSELETCMRYNALAHFSRFIPAGSVRVEARPDANDTVITPKDDGTDDIYERTHIAAFKTPDGRVVIVIVNEGNERKFNFSCLGKLKAEVWQSDADSQMENIYNGFAAHLINVPENSITTAVLY